MDTSKMETMKTMELKWEEIGRFPFSEEELSSIRTAKVVKGKFTHQAVRFTLTDGSYRFIPVSSNITLPMGKVDASSLIIIVAKELTSGVEAFRIAKK